MENFAQNWHHAESNMQSANEKFDAVNRLLEGDHVLVHIDTKSPGLELPPHLSKEATVTLKLSRWFRGAMVVEPDKIVAELLFNDRYHTCVIPLTAIWGVTADQGENLVWPNSLPREVAKALGFVSDGSDQARAPEAGESAPAPRARPKLRRVK